MTGEPPHERFESEARVDQIFPTWTGHLMFLILAVIGVVGAYVETGRWTTAVYAAVFIGALDGLMVLIGLLRRRLAAGQRVVVDPDRRELRLYNFRIRQGLLSQRRAEVAVPFEQVHGCRLMYAKHMRWILLSTSEGDVTLKHFMSDFYDLHRALRRIGGKAPLSSLLRDRYVQTFLILVLLTLIFAGYNGLAG